MYWRYLVVSLIVLTIINICVVIYDLYQLLVDRRFLHFFGLNGRREAAIRMNIRGKIAMLVNKHILVAVWSATLMFGRGPDTIWAICAAICLNLIEIIVFFSLISDDLDRRKIIRIEETERKDAVDIDKLKS